MKRFLFILLISLSAALRFFELSAYADEISLRSPDEIIPGRLFDTVVSIQTEHPLSAIQLEITASDELCFRSEKLCQSGEDSYYEDENCIKIILLADEAFTSGDLSELTFFAQKDISAEQCRITAAAVDAVGTSFENCPIAGSSASIDVNIKTSVSSTQSTADRRSASTSAVKQNERLTSAKERSSSKTSSKRAASSKSNSSADRSSKSSNAKKKENSSAEPSEISEAQSTAGTSSKAVAFKTETGADRIVYTVVGSVATLMVVIALSVAFRLGQHSANKRMK